jgi:hypothetical protein
MRNFSLAETLRNAFIVSLLDVGLSEDSPNSSWNPLTTNLAFILPSAF